MKSLTYLRQWQQYLINQKTPGTISYGVLSLNLSSNSKSFLFCTGRKLIKFWTFQWSCVFLITREAHILFNSRSSVSSSLHSQYKCSVFLCMEKCYVFCCWDWGGVLLFPLATKPIFELGYIWSVKLDGLLPEVLGCTSGLETPFCSEHLPLKTTQHPCLPYCVGLLLSCCHSCLCCLQRSFWNFFQIMAKYILPNGNI